MKIIAVELRRIVLPLVAPFRTSFGTQTVRVPQGAGIGVEPHADILEELTTAVEVIKT